MYILIIILICNLLIPLLMIIIGFLMYKHTPKSINWVYGYRTKRSMKNMDTWKFAHDYCGRLWFKIGFILLALSIIAMLPTIGASNEQLGNITIAVTSVQLCVLIVSIFFVEKALKENFDENGSKKSSI